MFLILSHITLDVLAHNHKVVYVAEAMEEPKTIQIRVRIDWTLERIKKEIATVAKEYGVSAHVMETVIKCESMYDTDIQSHHRRPDGTREQSFGLVQIHLPDHPSVTYDQAIDPQFAIRFLAEKLQAGQGRLWTCYRMHF